MIAVCAGWLALATAVVPCLAGAKKRAEAERLLQRGLEVTGDHETFGESFYLRANITARPSIGDAVTGVLEIHQVSRDRWVRRLEIGGHVLHQITLGDTL